jgi:hypothetical protein
MNRFSRARIENPGRTFGRKLPYAEFKNFVDEAVPCSIIRQNCRTEEHEGNYKLSIGLNREGDPYKQRAIALGKIQGLRCLGWKTY